MADNERKLATQMFAPIGGQNNMLAPTMLDPRQSPNIQNLLIKSGHAETAPGTEKLCAVTGRIDKIYKYIDRSETEHPLVFTEDFIYEYLVTKEQCILNQASQLLEDCEDAWDERVDAGLSCTITGTGEVAGTYRIEISGAATVVSGAMITEAISGVDITGYNALHCNIECDRNTSAGDIYLLASNSASGASPITAAVPALISGTKTCVGLAVDLTGLSGCASVGVVISGSNLPGQAFKIWIDDFRATTIKTLTAKDRWSVDTHNYDCIATDGLTGLVKRDSTGVFDSMSGASAYVPKIVTSFEDHLLLYNVTSSGVDYIAQQRHSKLGDLDYADTDWSDTTAGARIIKQNGRILAAGKLGESKVVIYFSDAIWTNEWIGGTSKWRTEGQYTGPGIVGRNAWCAVGPVHYVMLENDIVIYNGGSTVLSIVDKSVRNTIFDNLNAEYKHMVDVIYDEQRQLVRFSIPTSESYNREHWCYSLLYQCWFKWDRTWSGIGNYSNKAELTIGDLVGTIGDQTFRFGDASLGNDANIIMAGDYDGILYAESNTTHSLAGTAQTVIYETIDFTAMEEVDPLTGEKVIYLANYKRWTDIYSELAGDSCSIEYSTDGGDSWQGLPNGEKTLSSSFDFYKTGVDKISKKIRFRFITTADNVKFMMRWFSPRYIIESEY